MPQWSIFFKKLLDFCAPMEYNVITEKEKPKQNAGGQNAEVNIMAKATVELICATCGQSFEISKACYNRKEADEWVAYMSDHTDCTCSECYKKQKQAEREAEKQKFVEDVYSKLPLPQIEGVSEKQIKFAEDLRIKFVRLNRCYPESTRKEMGKFLKTETSARIIIDTLKNIL